MCCSYSYLCVCVYYEIRLEIYVRIYAVYNIRAYECRPLVTHAKKKKKNSRRTRLILFYLLCSYIIGVEKKRKRILVEGYTYTQVYSLYQS